MKYRGILHIPYVCTYTMDRCMYYKSMQVLLYDTKEVPRMETNGFRVSVGAATQVAVQAEYVSTTNTVGLHNGE
jgi:hypothetical protein